MSSLSPVLPSEESVDRRIVGTLGGYLTLFASVGTLICCALPAILVLLGFGAATASLLSSAPWLVTLSRNKAWVFGFSAALIVLNGLYLFVISPRLVARGRACSPDDAAACAAASRTSRYLFVGSAILFSAGFFTAYWLAPILEWWSS